MSLKIVKYIVSIFLDSKKKKIPLHDIIMIFCRCIPKKQVCLTSFEKFECSQHECVPRQLNCDQTRDPVCDTDNVEYTNLCTLYQKGKSLAYRGPCQVRSGPSNKYQIFFVPQCST